MASLLVFFKTRGHIAISKKEDTAHSATSSLVKWQTVHILSDPDNLRKEGIKWWTWILQNWDLDKVYVPDLEIYLWGSTSQIQNQTTLNFMFGNQILKEDILIFTEPWEICFWQP